MAKKCSIDELLVESLIRDTTESDYCEKCRTISLSSVASVFDEVPFVAESVLSEIHQRSEASSLHPSIDGTASKLNSPIEPSCTRDEVAGVVCVLVADEKRVEQSE